MFTGWVGHGMDILVQSYQGEVSCLAHDSQFKISPNVMRSR